MDKKVYIFDSTLRDGSQAQGISFSVNDKIKIVKILDDLGIDYVEAGNPASNPKDAEFFQKAKSEFKLKNSRLCAFGSTRRAGCNVNDDSNLKALLAAETEVVSIFGKSWDFHVIDIIKTTLEENLKMVSESIAYLKSHNKEVIFDAEHFFDGYKNNKEYAIEVLKAAQNAGADWIVLCDTNGGTLPTEIHNVVKELNQDYHIENLGIHCHNDSGTAVANSIVAVEAGVRHIQGTFSGYGERCGNTNLSTIIANLSLKMGYKTIINDNISSISTVYRYINEVSNIISNDREPYVGRCAFAHKGGMHIDAVNKNPSSFEHIEPRLVGNERRVLMSEVAGRSTIISTINKVDPNIKRDSEATKRIVQRLKELEYEGYQFEGAESSLELLVRKELGLFKPSFNLIEYKVIIDNPGITDKTALVVMKIMVNGVTEVTAADGYGPVNALDNALRKALSVFYKTISTMRLADYKVRVIDGDTATSAKVRVIIESTDGVSNWTTVGVSHDIIEASWKALVDSVEYKLLKN